MTNIPIAELTYGTENPDIASFNMTHIPIAQLTREAQATQESEENNSVSSSSSPPLEGQKEYEHLLGLQDHYKHKKYWSYFLMACMAGMIIFQSVLLWCVGIKFLDFTEYEWLLPALLVQNLAQIIGLAIFVVKALFKDVNE